MKLLSLKYEYIVNKGFSQDIQGQTVAKYNYDPWGRKRNPNTWDYEDSPYSQLFDRGYTTHQHLDEFRLINMNGRLYDLWIGRMLSPDPIIQDLANPQNYNRYSYALNNPLKFTDPSGYASKPYDWNLIVDFNSQPNAYFGNFTGRYNQNILSDLSYMHTDYYSLSKSGNYLDRKGNIINFNMTFDNYIAQNALQLPSNTDLQSIRFTSEGVDFATIDPTGSPMWSSLDTEFNWHSRRLSGETGGGMDEQGSNISMQEVATGVGAFSLANGVKTNLVEWGMKGADWGKAGAKYLKFVKRAGTVGFVVNVGISGYGSYDYYYNQNGTDWQVGAKSTLDIAMGVASFAWPIGTAISGAYFILDVSTGGFGGWGNPYKP